MSINSDKTEAIIFTRKKIKIADESIKLVYLSPKC